MIGWIYLVIVCLLVGAGFLAVIFTANEEGWMMTFIGCIIAIPLFISVNKHGNDLGTVRAYAPIVELREQSIAELKSEWKVQVPGLSQDNLLLANNDTPMATLTRSLLQAQDSLIEAREKIAHAKVNIARRKAGLMTVVVTIMGEE